MKTVNIMNLNPSEIEQAVVKAAPETVFEASSKQIESVQSRVNGTKKDVVYDYSLTPDELPPGDGFYDPETEKIYQRDGEHRRLARILAGERIGLEPDEVPIPLHLSIGSHDDAVLEASGANCAHGVPRSRKDKEHGVCMVLRTASLAYKSNGLIAKKAHVSVPFVEKMREKLEREGVIPHIARQDRVGLRKGKIFRSKAQTAKPMPAAPDTATLEGDGESDNLDVTASGPGVSSTGVGSRGPVNPTLMCTSTSTTTVDVDAGRSVFPASSASAATEVVSSALAAEIARQVAAAVQSVMADLLPAVQAGAKLELNSPAQPNSISEDSAS